MSTTTATANTSKVRAPKARVSYPHLDKPYAFDESQEPKYQCDLLFPKQGSDIAGLRNAMLNAVKAKWGPDKTKWPKNMKDPIRDGDEKDAPEYNGHWYVVAKNKRPPTLVDRAKQNLAGDAFYGGCWVVPVLTAYAFDKAGNRGVSFSLDGLQFADDGDKFGGDGTKVTDMFEDLDSGADDPKSYSGASTDEDPFGS